MLKPIIIAIAISCFIINYLKIDIGKANDNDFLFNFFGLLLGFALTIFSFIISIIEKIKDGAEVKYAKQPKKIKKMQASIKELYQEIKDDIAFTFVSLVIIGMLYIVDYQIANFHIVSNWYYDHVIMIKSLKLSLFVLNVYAIYDLVLISFKLSDTTGVFKLDIEDGKEE